MVSESSQAKAGPRRKLRLGMVGGGQGAFIGGVHRFAARLDGRYELVAGAFSSTAEKSKASGCELGLAAERCYGDFEEMAKREKRLKDGIDVVAIVTPNHVHFAGRQGVPRPRHPRHLRQAADDLARGCQEAGGPGREVGLRCSR